MARSIYHLPCILLWMSCLDRPDLLPLIKRKAHNKHELRAKQQLQQQRLNSMADEMSSGAFVSLEDGTPHPLAGGAMLHSHNGDENPESIYMMAALEQEQQKQKRIREDFEWR